MCTDCGCSSESIIIDGLIIDGQPTLSTKRIHPSTDSNTVHVNKNILESNLSYAKQNQREFAQRNALALNLMSSPGSGKTTLLTRTINELKTHIPFAVIEGDQQTENDAQRIRETGVKAIQINTGKGCHLDASMITLALERLPTHNNGVLFIENVGNLVCPAAFDLGEAFKILILSVTEGDDKPLKYPDIFHKSDILLLNKIDLLPYVDFDLARCAEYARRINPDIKILPISATTGQGLSDWYSWIESTYAAVRSNNKIREHEKL